ncbi:hypothetical protein IAQ61_009599 [Plenodomus lingam]|uniref:uncharacterized protein n=1 Tax=Leptosphaeria maculans TaxID=5022 RepID=UPI0033239FC3|nr:hypothetical protein IAQ61_009599 [Plenodomus lingam]
MVAPSVVLYLPMSSARLASKPTKSSRHRSSQHPDRLHPYAKIFSSSSVYTPFDTRRLKSLNQLRQPRPVVSTALLIYRHTQTDFYTRL